jgi:PAS domain S-box-containing protein
MATVNSGQPEPLRAQQDSVSQLAVQRQRLLQHAGAIIDRDPAKIDTADVARLTQTVVTALELLKVAEEELRDERRTNATIQAAQDLRLAHMEAVFALAPTPLVLTTGDTTIRQANAASARLFGVDVQTLAGMQLMEMIPKPQLAEFRKQLALGIEIGSVEAWSFTMQFRRTTPAVVSATMHVIDDVAVGARALYWNIRQ